MKNGAVCDWMATIHIQRAIRYSEISCGIKLMIVGVAVFNPIGKRILMTLVNLKLISICNSDPFATRDNSLLKNKKTTAGSFKITLLRTLRFTKGRKTYYICHDPFFRSDTVYLILYVRTKLHSWLTFLPFCISENLLSKLVWPSSGCAPCSLYPIYLIDPWLECDITKVTWLLTGSFQVILQM